MLSLLAMNGDTVAAVGILSGIRLSAGLQSTAKTDGGGSESHALTFRPASAAISRARAWSPYM